MENYRTYFQSIIEKITGCCCSVTKLCWTLCNPVNCSMPGFPILHCLLEFAQTHVCWVSDAIQPCYPLLPPSPLPSVFPSIRVFFSESTLCIRWPKYWSFSFSISSFQQISKVNFLSDWFDLLNVQGTLKSLLQYHSLNASILQHAASLWSNSHIHIWLLENHGFVFMDLC